MTLQRFGGFVAPPVFLLLAACGPSGPTGIDEPRELSERRLNPVSELTHGQRFGSEPLPGSAPSSQSRGLNIALPEGWEELPSSQFRDLNYRPAGDPELECYLTALGGDGGGKLPNVNRWRGQMGLEPITETELATLSEIDFLGVPAVFVDLEGSFAGMGGEQREGWRMLGLLATAPGQAVSLKLTGPAAKVGAQLENFLSLADAISASQRAPEDPAQTGQQSPVPPPAAAGGLSWTTPEGWTQGAPRTMRLASFVPKASPDIDISVTQLAGDAGGPQANFDRWRAQMGQEPLTEAEFTDLERVPVLDAEALVIEIDGRYVGMGDADQKGARMLGAIAPNGNGTLFVKMTGPRDAVEAESSAFRSFLTSLRRDN